MKWSKNKNKRRRQQEHSGRPVLVTFYVIQLRRDGGGARATSSHDVGHHHHRRRRQHHHHHLHDGGRHDERRRWNGGKFPDNRRADLLEYSRQLRALARQPTTTAAARPPATPRRRQLHDANTDVAVCGDEGHPTAVNRLERAMNQPQIRQRCFGGDDWWSWKRVLVLIFPIRKPRGPRRRMEDEDDSEKNRRDNNQKGWSAALPVGKLTVAKTRRDHGWFAKKLMSVFQKRP